MTAGFWTIAAPTVAWACMVVLAAVLWRRARVLRGRLIESEGKLSDLETRSAKAIEYLHRRVAGDGEDLRNEATSILEDCLSALDGRIASLAVASTSAREIGKEVADVLEEARTVERRTRYGGYAAALAEAGVTAGAARLQLKRQRDSLAAALEALRSGEMDPLLVDVEIEKVLRISRDLEGESSRALAETVRIRSRQADRERVRRLEAALERSDERLRRDEPGFARALPLP